MIDEVHYKRAKALLEIWFIMISSNQ
jgi:hypothetical protein